MEIKKIKYSILLPVKNGSSYISYCINSIIDQDFSNYELIISNDHSNDSSDLIIKKFSNSNIKHVTPPLGMSMTEHWQWLIGQSSGEWLLFVGQDDALQPYFFKLAEALTIYADKKSIRAIASRRSYLIWPGCEQTYRNLKVSYYAIPRFKIYRSFPQIILTLLGFKTYFEMPQMYTTSIFKRTLIDEVKNKQGGEIFTTHPQDANLAAIALILESNYLYSYIPLGWVGTSPKSAGYAVSLVESCNHEKNESIKNLRINYLLKISNSKYRYANESGDFRINSAILYLYGALIKVSEKVKDKYHILLKKRIVIILVYSAALSQLFTSKYKFNNIQYKLLISLIINKKINIPILITMAIINYLLVFIYKLVTFITRIFSLIIFNGIYIKIKNNDSSFNIKKINSSLHSKNIIIRLIIKLNS